MGSRCLNQFLISVLEWERHNHILNIFGLFTMPSQKRKVAFLLVPFYSLLLLGSTVVDFEKRFGAVHSKHCLISTFSTFVVQKSWKITQKAVTMLKKEGEISIFSSFPICWSTKTDTDNIFISYNCFFLNAMNYFNFYLWRTLRLMNEFKIRSLKTGLVVC